MKTIRFIFLILIFLAVAKADDTIIIEKFKKMTYQQQEEAIGQAPEEIKPQLQKILLHTHLVDQCGGEEALKRVKETQRSIARGLGGLLGFYSLQHEMSVQYIGVAMEANRNADMPYQKRREAEMNLKAKYDDAVLQRCHAIGQLVFKLAPSPAALELANKAEKLGEQIQTDLHLMESPTVPITKKKLDEINKEAEEMYEQLKKLPALTPQEVQQEYNAIPDEEVRINRMDAVGPGSQ
jgi:hypothetical protein